MSCCKIQHLCTVYCCAPSRNRAQLILVDMKHIEYELTATVLFLGGGLCGEHLHYIQYLENPAQCESYPENVCPGAGKRTDGKPLFMEVLSPVFVECAAICKRHFQKWSDKPGQCKVCRRNCSRDSICTRVHCYMDCNPKGPVFLCVNPCFHLFHTRH